MSYLSTGDDTSSSTPTSSPKTSSTGIKILGWGIFGLVLVAFIRSKS